jgi:hypothetical protein
VSSLIGGIAGSTLGLATGSDPMLGAGAGLALGVVSGMASNEIQNLVNQRSSLRRRPWLLAIDRLDQLVTTRAEEGSKPAQ